MSELDLYGPLAPLIGTWEGSKGDDTAPSDDRGTEKNKFRELIVFSGIGAADNHEQKLYVVAYERTAWRLDEDSPFHRQLGYWHWDAAAKTIMHSFIIPRAMTVLAGGSADANEKNLKVSAELGSATFGICSNPFLDREFKTVKYQGSLTIVDKTTMSYEEDTMIQMMGRSEIFHHVDKNTLKRTK